MGAAPLLPSAVSLHHEATGAAIFPAWGLGYEFVNENGAALLERTDLSRSGSQAT